MPLLLLWPGLILANCLPGLEQLDQRDALWYLPGSDQPFSGCVESYYDNGQQQLRVVIADGRRHGREQRWREDGSMDYQILYRHGQPQTQGSVWYARERPTSSQLQYCDELPGNPMCKSVLMPSRWQNCGEARC